METNSGTKLFNVNSVEVDRLSVTARHRWHRGLLCSGQCAGGNQRGKDDTGKKGRDSAVHNLCLREVNFVDGNRIAAYSEKPPAIN